MSLLEQVQTGKSPAPRRCLLFGTHGIGKSTFGARAPNPIFIQTEDGLSEIDCVRFPLVEKYDQVITAISELYSSEHSFKTVVVDSLDWLERLVWAEACQKRNVENIEDFGYGKGYSYALDFWKRIIDGLSALREHRNMTVILIAHSKIERFEDPQTDPYDRYVPRLHRRASDMVQEWCDEVLFTTYKTYTKKTDMGFNRKRTQGIGTGERVVFTTERPAHVAKNRLNLPDELPLDWNTYAKYFTNSHENEDENKRE